MSIYKSWNTEMYCRNEMLISPQHTPNILWPLLKTKDNMMSKSNT